MISNEDRANHYRVEYDARNPRLRMNILGFLLSEGEVPGADETDEFLEKVDKMVNFITNDVEPFAGLVQSLEDENVNQIRIVEDDDDNHGGGIQYL